jgi:hypothetical protein
MIKPDDDCDWTLYGGCSRAPIFSRGSSVATIAA